jgi:Rab-like protein 2
VANKIDVDYRVTERSFAFPTKHKLPFFFVSASDGTNVVKVFQQAIMTGLEHKENPSDDFMTMALELLGE